MGTSMRIPNEGDLRFFEETSLQYEVRALRRRLGESESDKGFQKAIERGDKWRKRYEEQVEKTRQVRAEGDKKLTAAERDSRN